MTPIALSRGVAIVATGALVACAFACGSGTSSSSSDASAPASDGGDAIADAGGATADADADAGPAYVERGCFSGAEAEFSGRPLTQIALFPVFAALQGGDSPVPGFWFRGHGPVLVRDGSAAVETCVPRGGTSVAGARSVRWLVRDAAQVETAEEACSKTYFPAFSTASGVPFAEHPYPGKSAAELSAVRVVQPTGAPFVYTTNKSKTEYLLTRPRIVYVRDGFIATSCASASDKVTFVLPTGVAPPEVSEEVCDAGIAKHAYPKLTAMELAASLRVVSREVDYDRVEASQGGEVLYRDQILEDSLLVADDGAAVHCLAQTSGSTSVGPKRVTFVRW